MSDQDRPDHDPLGWPALESALREQPPRYDSRTAWAKLEHAMDETAPPAQTRPLRTRSRPAAAPGPRVGVPSWITGIAALLVLGVGLGFAWRMTLSGGSSVVAPAALREVATARGQRAMVRLGDGTRVELGMDSKLRYAPEFGAGRRDVYLEGEAYFDVVHDERRPFAVHTARAVVRDIGTKFNVRDYADIPSVEVVVAEGAVALASTGRLAHDSVLLRPSDLGRVESDGRLTAQRDVDVAAYLAWLDGRLVFVDAPLREVMPRLARWYGVDVRLGDSTIRDVRYTASIKHETLPELLDLMARSLELRVKRSGDTVLLYSKSGTRGSSQPR